MSTTKNLSSFEKILLGIDQPEVQQVSPLHRKGDVCPKCQSAPLDYNGMLQLECPQCGFTEGGEGVGCT